MAKGYGLGAGPRDRCLRTEHAELGTRPRTGNMTSRAVAVRPRLLCLVVMLGAHLAHCISKPRSLVSRIRAYL